MSILVQRLSNPISLREAHVNVSSLARVHASIRRTIRGHGSEEELFYKRILEGLSDVAYAINSLENLISYPAERVSVLKRGGARFEP